MPTKRVVKKRNQQRGSGLFDSIKKAILSAASFAKKHKLISRGANLLGNIGIPHAGKVGAIASNLGYGKRKVKKGKGLLIAGQKYVKKGAGMKKPMPKRKTALRVKTSFP